jgi:hypothetical protein
MPDFFASLLGAVVGALAAISAAWIAYRGSLRSDRKKAERQALSDVMAAAYDWDTALLTMHEGIGKKLSQEKMVALDEEVRAAGRTLDRLAYLVVDSEARRLALKLAEIGWGVRVAIIPPSSRPDLDAVRRAREALAVRANEVIAKL